jgi:hypothetical protein
LVNVFAGVPSSKALYCWRETVGDVGTESPSTSVLSNAQLGIEMERERPVVFSYIRLSAVNLFNRNS